MTPEGPFSGLSVHTLLSLNKDMSAFILISIISCGVTAYYQDEDLSGTEMALLN